MLYKTASKFYKLFYPCFGYKKLMYIARNRAVGSSTLWAVPTYLANGKKRFQTPDSLD